MKFAKALPVIGTLLATIGFVAVAHATVYVRTGTVKEIVMYNSALVSTGDLFTLNGVTSAGSCGTSDGLVVMMLPARTTNEYKSMMSIVQSAKLAGRPIEARLDDTVLTNGYCTVRQLGARW